MDAWEYKVLTQKTEGWFSKNVSEERATDELNALGEEGWELVGALPVTGEGFTTKSVALFLKRKRRG